jgi:hypothetical protein
MLIFSFMCLIIVSFWPPFIPCAVFDNCFILSHFLLRVMFDYCFILSHFCYHVLCLIVVSFCLIFVCHVFISFDLRLQYLPCVRGTRAKTLLPLENGPECSFVSLSCILNFLFTSVWIVRKIDRKSKEINTWSIAGKLKLVSVQNRPLMVTWDGHDQTSSSNAGN